MTKRTMGTTLVATATESLHESTSEVYSDADRKYAVTEAKASDDRRVEQKIVWRNVIVFIFAHVAAFYGLYLAIVKAKVATLVCGFLYGSCAGLGVTAGAHRLWAHRSYKAKWQLRVILGIFQTIAFQNHIYEWSRDHRVHHKFSETDADPHNAKRGFFFSHMGWLLVKKHPDVRTKGKAVDMSDLEKDFVVVFQRRYYALLMPLLTFIIPTIVPVYLWNEDPWVAWYLTVLRWVLSLNGTWLVNSAAHMWGNKPYDKTKRTMVTTLVATANESLHESTSEVSSDADRKYAVTEAKASDDRRVEQKIVWRNVIVFTFAHVAAFYGLYLAIVKAKVVTVVCGLIYGTCGGLGITAGAHRLWTHRSYKAKWQLRVILGIFQTIAFQNHIYEWSRDHRVHHKFSETDADPHNAKRGFFFSHMGWLLVKKHPDVRTKGKAVDMSDLEKDFVVVFQRRYYLLLMPLLTFIIPTIVPVYLWNEDPWVAWYYCVFRWVYILNGTWLVNSAAHMWGNKPYDKLISPSENITVAILTYGEGFHNYHHVFPYDYKTAELGDYMFNPTTAFIDFFARIGWAYSLKTTSKETILKRIARTGDGKHKFSSKINSAENADSNTDKGRDSHEDNLWGWGDADMKTEDYKFVSVLGSEDVE